MINKLITFKRAIYKNAKAKGFWDDQPPMSQQSVMLKITELSEAVDAHRTNKFFCDVIAETHLNNWDGTDGGWSVLFKTDVKDTIGDKIADAVIRILDYCAGNKIKIIERDYRKKSSGNFATDILNIVKLILLANDKNSTKDYGYVLAAIIKLCEWNGIDLVQHIAWKMRYNSIRPHMHGKRY